MIGNGTGRFGWIGRVRGSGRDGLEQLEWFGINRTVWEGQDELNWIVWIRMDRMNQNKCGVIKMDRMD